MKVYDYKTDIVSLTNTIITWDETCLSEMYFIILITNPLFLARDGYISFYNSICILYFLSGIFNIWLGLVELSFNMIFGTICGMFYTVISYEMASEGFKVFELMNVRLI